LIAAKRGGRKVHEEMRVTFQRPGDKAPSKLLAEVTLHEFIDAFPSLTLGGFTIWEGNEGPWLKFPGRQYQKNGQTKSFDFLRGERGDTDGFKSGVLKRFAVWLEAGGGRSETSDQSAETGESYSNPFA
jgi:hypothetical protein